MIRLLVITAAAVLANAAAWGTSAAAGLAASAVTGSVYGWSLLRHPNRRCWRCGGSKRHDDTTVWRGTSGTCLVCRGKGRYPRWGTRIFMPRTARAIRRGGHGKYY